MDQPLTEDDEGKQVVTRDGETVGTVRKVDQGVLHVEPSADLSERVRERLDWGDRQSDDYTLQETEVEETTDREVRLAE